MSRNAVSKEIFAASKLLRIVFVCDAMGTRLWCFDWRHWGHVFCASPSSRPSIKLNRYADAAVVCRPAKPDNWQQIGLIAVWTRNSADNSNCFNETTAYDPVCTRSCDKPMTDALWSSTDPPVTERVIIVIFDCAEVAVVCCVLILSIYDWNCRFIFYLCQKNFALWLLSCEIVLL